MQVDEVKNIMVDNIEKVLERGEKIELLVDKTDNLRFQVQSVSVMSSAWQTLIMHSRKLQQAPAGGSVCICAGDVSHGLHKALVQVYWACKASILSCCVLCPTCCLDADPISLLGKG